MFTPEQGLEAFIEESNTIFAEGRIRAQGLPPQTIQVWPGGATFTTIQAAINSITDASPQVQYQVAVGPGTYKETVAMKDYVYIIGTQQNQTFIATIPQVGVQNGVVNSPTGAGNSGISNLTINASYGDIGSYPICVKVCGTGKVHLNGITFTAGDTSAAANVITGITINPDVFGGTTVVSQSMMQLSGGFACTSMGIQLGQKAYLQADLTTIEVHSAGTLLGGQSYGVITGTGATVTLNQSKIIADSIALLDADNNSLITANKCIIMGPVLGKVIINN